MRVGLILGLALLQPFIAVAQEPFAIQIVDEQTNRGVPLVELKTVSGLRYYSDSVGVVAIREPELFGRNAYFHIRSHGYEFPRDGFGFHGAAVEIKPGGERTLKIKRRNIAERLYRVTGAGIYADSVVCGRKPPLAMPLLNAGVTGSDSVINAVYRGRLYWFWGDTNHDKYPLGVYDASGAVSKLPGDGGLKPAEGVDLEYFVDDKGYARKTAPMAGAGPTWLFGMVVLKDDAGRESLFTGYEKVHDLMVHQRGLARWDDERNEFVSVRTYDKAIPLYLHGHPFLHRDGDVEYVYFGDPYPVMRVPARSDLLADPSKFEGFTCLKPGGRGGEDEVERDAAGKPVWGWKRDTAAVSLELQEALMKKGKLQREEVWLRFVDIDGGKPIKAHRGSVTWNERLKKFVLITTQIEGASMLGEVWFAVADKPEGPWRKAKKIVTHDKYSFYNPKQHPYFAEDGGRWIYFEGTYTAAFSGNEDTTPRYDYNQIMYRLDVEDPRLDAVR